MATPHSIRPPLDSRPSTNLAQRSCGTFTVRRASVGLGWSYGRLQDAVNPGAWVRHIASTRGRMTDDARRGLDRLAHHADRLDKLVHLLGSSSRVVRGRENTEDLAHELYREIRLALRQDYDAGERRELSKADVAYVQSALYGAYAVLSGGSTLRPQRMLSEAKKAHRVIQNAVVEMNAEPTGDDEGA